MSNLKLKYLREIFSFSPLSKYILIPPFFPYHQIVHHLPSTSNQNPAMIFDSSLSFIFTINKFYVWLSKCVTIFYLLHSCSVHWSHQNMLPGTCQVFINSSSSSNPAPGLDSCHFPWQVHSLPLSTLLCVETLQWLSSSFRLRSIFLTMTLEVLRSWLCPWLWVYLPLSPSQSFCSCCPDFPLVPQTRIYQPCFYPRTIALHVSSTWNTLPTQVIIACFLTLFRYFCDICFLACFNLGIIWRGLPNHPFKNSNPFVFSV